jgi:hypothetical protein
MQILEAQKLNYHNGKSSRTTSDNMIQLMFKKLAPERGQQNE